MSKLVCHMEKYKRGDIKRLQVHNQREKEIKTNPDIDKNRTKLNVDLANEENIIYTEKINKIIEDAGVTRKIQDDATLMCEFIISSDQVFFKEKSREESLKFFQSSLGWFEERYGKQNIIAASVHYDETTPHMHLSLVPVTNNVRKRVKNKDEKIIRVQAETDKSRLSAATLFDKKELKEIQKSFYIDVGSKFGLERGEEGSKTEHLSVKDYKIQESKKKISQLESENMKNIKELEIKNGTVKILRGSVVEKSKALDKLSEQLKNDDEHSSDLSEEIKNKDEIIAKLYEEIKIKDESLTALEEKNTKEKERLEAEFAKEHNYYDKEFQNERNELNEKIKTKDKELAILRGKNQELETDLGEKGKMLAAMQRKYEELEREVRKMTSAAAIEPAMPKRPENMGAVTQNQNEWQPMPTHKIMTYAEAKSLLEAAAEEIIHCMGTAVTLRIVQAVKAPRILFPLANNTLLWDNY